MYRVSELPEWVVPDLDQVQECWRMVRRLVERGNGDARDQGVSGSLVWLVIGGVSPITHRPGAGVSWELARAESWSALCVAAGMPPPAARDWQRLGAEPRPAVTSDRQYAYGAWRALTWLLGVRDEWPVYSAWHRSAEMPDERPHMKVPRSERNTAAWQAAARTAREQDEADALMWWTHVRHRADATDTTKLAETSAT